MNDSTDGKRRRRSNKGPGEEDIFNRDFYLESSWKDVVDGSEEMERAARVQQESIWELISTEKTYISDLRTVTQVIR